METILIKDDTIEYDVYLGRTDEKFHFCNPFCTKKRAINTIIVSSPEKAVLNYLKWLLKEDFNDVQPERRDWILTQIPSLKGKRLGNFSNYHYCNGNVLLAIINDDVKSFREKLEPKPDISDLFEF